MKIRTDFVTNSSSSSFSVVVTITDKKGKIYRVEDDTNDYSEDCGRARFCRDLGLVLPEYVYDEVSKLNGKTLAVDETSIEERNARNARIEKVKVGDVVTLEKVEITDDTTYYYGAERCYIEVRNKEGSLGRLPGCSEFFEMAMDTESIQATAVVSSVTPLSQRRKNARKALLSVEIKFELVDDTKNVLCFSDISDLCSFLTESITDDSCVDYEDEYDEEEEHDEECGWEEDEFGFGPKAHQKSLQEEKDRFTTEVVKKVKTISNISKIGVYRNYFANGEFAELIADNDWKLRQLAEKVHSLSGEEREKAKAEMLEYIHTPNGARAINFSFGSGFEDFRYNWDDDENALNELVERICSSWGPDYVSGRECWEIDMETGEYTKYAEFDLR